MANYYFKESTYHKVIGTKSREIQVLKENRFIENYTIQHILFIAGNPSRMTQTFPKRHQQEIKTGNKK